MTTCSTKTSHSLPADTRCGSVLTQAWSEAVLQGTSRKATKREHSRVPCGGVFLHCLHCSEREQMWLQSQQYGATRPAERVECDTVVWPTGAQCCLHLASLMRETNTPCFLWSTSISSPLLTDEFKSHQSPSTASGVQNVRELKLTR